MRGVVISLAVLAAASVNAQAQTAPVEKVILEPVATFTIEEIQRRIAPGIQAPFPVVVKPPKSYPDPIDIGPPGEGNRAQIGDGPAIDPDAGAASRSPMALTSCAPSTNYGVKDSFLAATDTNTSIPPDTTGAVGPNHLVTTLNTDIVIRLRDGSLVSTVSLDSFFSIPLGGNPFDPRVVFDPFIDRWIIIADANAVSPNSAVYIALSSTDDPTGAWSFFSIDADSTDTFWADYPGIGFNEKWIVITNNMFGLASGFGGAKMWVIEKTPLLDSGTLVVNTFDNGFDMGPFQIASFTLKPAQAYDEGEPKIYIASNPGVSSGSTPVLRLSEISGPENAPTWAPSPGSIFQDGSGDESGFFLVDNEFSFSVPTVPQLGSASRPAAGDRRLSAGTKLQNGRIYIAHSGGFPASAPDRAATFWYELDPAGLAATGDPILQSGVIDEGPGEFTSYPSIAANCAGEIVVGFSRASANRYIEAAVAYRQAGDPLGTMRPIETIKPGEDAYIKTFGGGSIRWGDYSETMLDPTDDRSIWTTQEYAAMEVGPSSSQDRWGIWWARIGGDAPNTCVPDVTTLNTNPGDAGYGVPDGLVDGADLSYFIEFWLADDLSVGDVTTQNTNPGDADYGVPDGSVDGADLSFFVEVWLAGCN